MKLRKLIEATIKDFVNENEENANKILDKVSQNGKESLTPDEKTYLEQYSDNDIDSDLEEFSDEINQRVIIKGNYSEDQQYDIIVHLAAATDVGESITDPMKYVEQNIVETAKLLEFARTLPNLEKFIFISSNEVFGPAMYDVNYSELDRLNPYSPYSGTKAAAEQLCASYFNTYKMPISIVRTMNVFGERQTARRFFPVVVRKILDGEEINIFDNFRTYIFLCKYTVLYHNLQY